MLLDRACGGRLFFAGFFGWYSVYKSEHGQTVSGSELFCAVHGCLFGIILTEYAEPRLSIQLRADDISNVIRVDSAVYFI